MFERQLLSGRSILVTGRCTGLGKAMALRYAELGAQVAVLGGHEQHPRDPVKQALAGIRAQTHTPKG